MDINKKNRSQLKSYFVKNSIPTQSNFEELIDGMLNQNDDGIVKSPDALCIEATGDLAGLQRVINFYAKFQDDNPAWSLQLNPRTDANDPATAKAGFCVADGRTGAARLFIDKATGNVGIGLNDPRYSLDVKASKGIKFGLEANGGGQLIITNTRDDNKITLEARNKEGAGSAAELLLTGINGKTIPKLSLMADMTLIKGDVDIRGGLREVKFGISSAGTGLYFRRNSRQNMSLESFSVDSDGVPLASSPLTLSGIDTTNVPFLNLMADVTNINGTLRVLSNLVFFKDKMGANINYGPDPYRDINSPIIRLIERQPNTYDLEVSNPSAGVTLWANPDRGIKFVFSEHSEIQTFLGIYQDGGNIRLEACHINDSAKELLLTGINKQNLQKISLLADETYINGDLKINGQVNGDLKINGQVNGDLKINGHVNIAGTIKMGMGSNSAGLEFRNRSGIMTLESFNLDASGVALVSPNLTLSGRNITNVPALTLMADMTDITGDLTIQGRIISEKWIDAKLENNWVRYSNEFNPAQYFKDNAGIVWLRGLVKAGSSTIFTLPEGYRPSNRQLHVVSIAESTVGRIDVTKDGKVESVKTHPTWTSLDGISFRAAPK